MAEVPELPFLQAPHDALRHGLSNLKNEALAAHPVETIIKQHPIVQQQTRRTMQNHLYGPALALREEIDLAILNRPQRLPGLQSSRLGFESLTGELDSFDFGDYLGGPCSEVAPKLGLHDIMERKLGMTPATKEAVSIFK